MYVRNDKSMPRGRQDIVKEEDLCTYVIVAMQASERFGQANEGLELADGDAPRTGRAAGDLAKTQTLVLLHQHLARPLRQLNSESPTKDW